MRGYALDLRERIVRAVGQGEGKTAVSKRFDVSLSTVKRYVKRQAQGELAASKHPGRQRQLNDTGCKQLQKQVKEHHDWRLERHAQELSKEIGVEIKKSSVGNYLKRLGITHKKRASAPQSEMNDNERSTSVT